MSAALGIVPGLVFAAVPAQAVGGDSTAAAERPAGTVDSTVAVAVDVLTDGNGPFTPDAVPGGDTGSKNGTVRTMDAITYRVSLNSNDGSSTNERFTATAPSGTTWAGVPSRCTGAGSAIAGAELLCNIGTLTEGNTVFVPIVLNVSGDMRNGDAISVPVTATADGAENGSVGATSDTVTVSAAARYNLSKDVHASRLITDAVGPDGSPGLQVTYPIAVDWQPLVAGQGLLGFEKSAGPMTFTDDLSKILGDLPSGAVLWNAGRPVCGHNTSGPGVLPGLPAGAGGGATGVVDSGRITCVQDAPGSAVEVTITGTITDPTQFPTKNVDGGPVVGGDRNYVVSGYISLWMPNPPTGTSVDSVNTFTPLRTTSISGAQNYPGGTEPTSDNSAARTITEYGSGGISKQLYRVTNDTGDVIPGSAKAGEPWHTPGDAVRSDIGMWNDGLTPYENAILCDTFDRSTQRLTQVDGQYSWVSGMTGDVKVQYAAYEMSSPAAGQRQATCEDDAGPWFEDPADVPGGIDAIGAVRAVGDVPGGSTGALYSFTELQDAADGTRAYDFGHGWFGDRDPRWQHDTWSDADLGAGPLSDSVLITENLARIQKKVVDPGHDAGDTPNETSFALAGDTVDYALYPSLTNGKASGRASTVTVRDVLPHLTRYVPDSASVTPEIDTTTDERGRDVQRLTWTFDTEPNQQVAPITYRVQISELFPPGAITNVAGIDSPTDRSPTDLRTAARALQIVNTGGVGVEKTAVEPVVITGDRLEWTLGYTNIDATPIDGIDVIDVIPHRGDAGRSTFHGTSGLAEVVTVDAAAGERALYTSRAPRDVVNDAADPSNAPGGATRWCTEAELGAVGCPTDLADVTAFRIQRSAPVGVGETVTHEVAVATDGQQDGDTHTNRFGLRASNLALPVQSNPATITVVAGSIGDLVWSDDDRDGLQDDDEPGVPGATVHLAGIDDTGAAVDQRTTTNAAGAYAFDGLRPGTYTVRWTAVDGRDFTTALVGDDRSVDSDAAGDGTTRAITIATSESAEGRIEGVEQDRTIDAGLLPAPEGPVEPPVGPEEPEGPGVPGDPEGPGDTGGDAAPEVPPGPADSGSPVGADRGAAASATGSEGALAFTGAAGLSLIAGAAALLLVLGAAVLGFRRHRADHVPEE